MPSTVVTATPPRPPIGARQELILRVDTLPAGLNHLALCKQRASCTRKSMLPGAHTGIHTQDSMKDLLTAITKFCPVFL